MMKEALESRILPVKIKTFCNSDLFADLTICKLLKTAMKTKKTMSQITAMKEIHLRFIEQHLVKLPLLEAQVV